MPDGLKLTRISNPHQQLEDSLSTLFSLIYGTSIGVFCLRVGSFEPAEYLWQELCWNKNSLRLAFAPVAGAKENSPLLSLLLLAEIAEKMAKLNAQFAIKEQETSAIKLRESKDSGLFGNELHFIAVKEDTLQKLFVIHCGEAPSLQGEPLDMEIPKERTPLSVHALSPVPVSIVAKMMLTAESELARFKDSLAINPLRLDYYLSPAVGAPFSAQLKMRGGSAFFCFKERVTMETALEEKESVELTIDIGSITIPLSELYHLRPGSEICLYLPAPAPVTLRCGSAAWGRGVLKLEGGNCVLQVEELVSL